MHAKKCNPMARIQAQATATSEGTSPASRAAATQSGSIAGSNAVAMDIITSASATRLSCRSSSRRSVGLCCGAIFMVAAASLSQPCSSAAAAGGFEVIQGCRQQLSQSCYLNRNIFHCFMIPVLAHSRQVSITDKANKTTRTASASTQLDLEHSSIIRSTIYDRFE